MIGSSQEATAVPGSMLPTGQPGLCDPAGITPSVCSLQGMKQGALSSKASPGL